MKLFKMNIINILRSFPFKIFIIFQILPFIALVYLFSREATNTTFYNFFLGVGFFEMPIIVLSTCFSIYSSTQKITLENICFIPYRKTTFVKFIATMSISFSLLVLPIMAMLLNIPKTDFMYTMLGIFEIVIRWSALIISTQIIGFLIGKLFKSYIAYIFAIPLTFAFTYLNDSLFIMIGDTNQFIQNIFLLNRMFPFSGMSNFSGPIISIFTVSKALMIISFFAMILSIYFICKKSKKSIILTSIFAILTISSFLLYSNFYPEFYSYNVSSENLIIEKFNNNAQDSFEITSYEGEINLKEFMKADMELHLNKLSKTDVLQIKLDASLNILSLKSQGEDISYKRDGDYIYINDTSLLNQDNFPIEISYSGRISYGENNIYTTNFASSLPSVFAFVPLIEGDDSIHKFDIDVFAKNTVVSNVDFKEVDNNTYSIVGESDTFMLYCGFLDSYTNNNQIVYYGKYIPPADLSLYKSARDFNNLELKDINISSVEKVFILSNYLHGQNFSIDYENYLLIAESGR